MTLNFTTAALAEGQYSGIITISGQSGVPQQTVTVDLDVYGEPIISTSTSTINVSAAIGSASLNRTFTVWNSGTGTLNFTVSDDQTWLQVTPGSGASTGSGNAVTLTATLDPSGLGEDTHNGTITIDGGSGVAPKTVNVQFTVFG